MTEINNNVQTPPPARRERLTRADANRISGLGSGLDTESTIRKLIQVERQRLIPIQDRRLEASSELESFSAVKKGLEALKESAEALSSNSVWEAKIVESSDDSVVTAVATQGASPGKHTLVVDRLALNHQMASQGFETPEDVIGRGSVRVSIGENPPVTITIDDTNDSLTGIKDAINGATEDLRAAVIKTGNRNRPYQLVLTSQKTGTEGRITVEIGLEGGEAPNFMNSVEDPSEWAGVGELAPPSVGAITGTGASTVIVRVIGEYTGDDDVTFDFTAVQTGIVGGETSLQMRWTDTNGRSGVVELDGFNYAPGEPKELIDGLSLVVSQGEIIVGDEFSFSAREAQSSAAWWLTDQERAPQVSQPTPWGRQATTGTPIIEGEYTGEDDTEFTLSIEGSGQIGTSKSLRIKWENSDGKSGVLSIGQGYVPGSQLALVDGLTVKLNPGVLNTGSIATFPVIAQQVTGKWWKSDSERRIPSVIGDITNFEPPEDVDEEFTQQPEFPEDFGPRVSSVDRTISGEFTGDAAKVYTFTALRNGTVGVTRDLALRWEDEEGNSGRLSVGDNYQIGTPLPFDSGLSVAFGSGRIFNEDTFTVRTRTSTIQPAQDSLIRLGATELGGGLPISNSTNELSEIIEGVNLTLVSSNEKPVTITIRGDVDQAVESVKSFVDNYNELMSTSADLSKFDKDSNEAGPLLGDSDLNSIRNQLSELLINPVSGLPPSSNMVFTLGMRLNNDGLIDFDESKLLSKIDDDFGAVADLFRDRGQSDNSGVTFVGMSESTPASPGGLAVDITQIATPGEYRSPELSPLNEINATNNRFFITADGRKSALLELEPGIYDVATFAQILQNAITDDELIGEFGVRVSADGDTLRVVSGRFGSRSEISFAPMEGMTDAAFGLLNGVSVPGLDVEGTIGGEPAQGIGNLLRGGDDSTRLAGLRLLVTLNESQLSEFAAEASIKITKGVASRMNSYLDKFLDSRGGRMSNITGNLNSQIDNIDDQLERMEERIESKRARLLTKFARMESQMSTLKNQRSFMAAQLGGGGGSAALPGL